MKRCCRRPAAPPFLPALLWVALIAVFGAAAPALAWDDTGHKVVARIAWDNLRPEVRQRVVSLLRSAPADADLASLLPTGARPASERQRVFFLRASTWPDLVRERGQPERRARYHKATWHYVNFFFEQNSPTDPPRDLPNRGPEPVNVVERLGALTTELRDTHLPAAQRAVDLAWVLHLTGDVHQPLHTSARVTPTEPQGDQGGNLFKRGTTQEAPSLHGFWDGVLTRSAPQRAGESEDAYIARLAAGITAHYPLSGLQPSLKPGQFAAWAQEGYQTAKTQVYTPDLRRGQLPSEEYRKRALRIAEPAIARAGYRLAALLNHAFAAPF